MIINSSPATKAPITHRYIKSAVVKVFKGELTPLDILCINFVDKKSIRKINKQFLAHNYYTDIITFPYEEKRNVISGEIYMCPDVIKENSSIYGTSFRNEFERVLIHGCLHLTGSDDRTKKQKELIREKENFYLSL